MQLAGEQRNTSYRSMSTIREFEEHVYKEFATA